MRHQPNGRGGAGFTLVELLVVIGVIAALIAVLLPTLGKARAEAASTRCKANLHELFIAQTLYAADHRGRYTPLTPEASERWERKLGRYLNVKRRADGTDPLPPASLMHCPATAVAGAPGAAQVLSTYGLNSWLMAPRWRMRSAAKFPASQTILMGDKSLQADPHLTTEDGYYLVHYLDEGVLINNPLHDHAGTYRHGTRHGRGRANMVMADGHVEALAPGELTRPSRRWYWTELPPEVSTLVVEQNGCCP